MKSIKFVMAVLMAMIFQSGHGMENWYGKSLCLALKGEAAQAVSIVHNNDPKSIEVINPERVPEEIKYIILASFVATGEKGKAIRSIDGINWKESILPSADNYYVCYGNNKFVAVGGANVAYSDDGINWVRGTLPFEIESFYSLCYGNNIFVVGANGGNVAYYDGTTWGKTKIPDSSGNVMCIGYGNGKFVAIDNIGKLYHSADGKNWLGPFYIGPSESRLCPWSVCCGKNKFVAAGEDKLAHSENGEVWSQVIPSEDNTWAWVCYGKGKFIAVPDNPGKAIYSEDGIDWYTIANFPSSEKWSFVCYGNDKFIAMTQSDSKFTWSEDGINWAPLQNLPIVMEWPWICCKSN